MAFVFINGKRKSKTFDLKRDAAAWAAQEAAAAKDREGRLDAELHTLQEMLGRYSKDVSTKKKGARSEQLRITVFLRNFPALTDKRLSGIRTVDIAGWHTRRQDGKRVAAGLVAAVLRDLRWMMSNAFTVACDE